jgi:hypothetical protein
MKYLNDFNSYILTEKLNHDLLLENSKFNFYKKYEKNIYYINKYINMQVENNFDNMSINTNITNDYLIASNGNGDKNKEILEKEQQVKDIMFINDTHWYLNTLRKIGFKEIHIINSSWCFNTFLSKK